jgi:DNA-binding MarR family transcriptional regulator
MPHESMYEFARQHVPCVNFNIRRVTRLVTQLYDRILAPTGLRSTQYSLLNVLSLIDGLRMQDLALILAMDRTTLSRNLRPLIKQGWINVSTGNDRRTRLVQITPKGRTVLEKALPYWEEAQTFMTERLGPSNWDKVMSELHTISMIAEEGL